MGHRLHSINILKRMVAGYDGYREIEQHEFYQSSTSLKKINRELNVLVSSTRFLKLIFNRTDISINSELRFDKNYLVTTSDILSKDVVSKH